MSMSIKELQIYFKIYVKLFPVPQILLDHRAQCMTTAPCEEELFVYKYVILLSHIQLLDLLFCFLVIACFFNTLYVYIIIKTIKTIFCVSRFFHFMKKKHVFTMLYFNFKP